MATKVRSKSVGMLPFSFGLGVSESKPPLRGRDLRMSRSSE